LDELVNAGNPGLPAGNVLRQFIRIVIRAVTGFVFLDVMPYALGVTLVDALSHGVKSAT
jgi:hypothetical protein